MRQPTIRKCARCGFVLDQAFRFCPGCSLPTSGDEVFSTEIAARRHEAERKLRRAPMTRALVAGSFILTGGIVAALGLVVFSPNFARLILGDTAEAGIAVVEPAPSFEPEWSPSELPAGDFVSGPPSDARWETIETPFFMSLYEVRNSLWQEFLEQRHEDLAKLEVLETALPGPLGGWEGMRPRAGEGDRPVRNVSPLAAAHFCEWLTARVGQDGWEIRLPTRLEWEYAARGNKRQNYPWGDEFYAPAPPRSGDSQPRRRKNLETEFPSNVHWVDDDTSPFGIVAMGTNVEEFAIGATPAEAALLGERAKGARPSLSTLIREGQIKVSRCGASYASDQESAKRTALAWATLRDLEARARSPHIGIRLVKVRRRATETVALAADK